MYNLIKLTGIPATGKTFFLELCKKNNILTNGYYIDIGREITELLKSRELKKIEDFDSCYIEILGDIIKNRQPAIITNHLVFKINDRLTYYERLEALTIPKGYIIIRSDPKDILKRRIDNNLEERIRKVEDLKHISTHQTIESNITYRLAKKYDIGCLSIFNTKETVEENFTKIREFVVTSLKK